MRPLGIGNDTPLSKTFGVNAVCLIALTDRELSKPRITRVVGLCDRFEPPQSVSHL